MHEVEIDGDGLAFGGIDLDGSEVGGKRIGWELKFERGARHNAGAAAATAVVCVAIGVGGRERLIAVIDLHLEVFPEIARARRES